MSVGFVVWFFFFLVALLSGYWKDDCLAIGYTCIIIDAESMHTLIFVNKQTSVRIEVIEVNISQLQVLSALNKSEGRTWRQLQYHLYIILDMSMSQKKKKKKCTFYCKDLAPVHW